MGGFSVVLFGAVVEVFFSAFAPIGFKLEAITYSHQVHAVTANTSHQVRVTNRRPSHEITILKEDADTQTPLADAVFSLYGDDYYLSDGTTINTNAVPILSGVTSNAQGLIDLGLVAGGEYYLVETNAPNGYLLVWRKRRR